LKQTKSAINNLTRNFTLALEWLYLLLTIYIMNERIYFIIIIYLNCKWDFTRWQCDLNVFMCFINTCFCKIYVSINNLKTYFYTFIHCVCSVAISSKIANLLQCNFRLILIEIIKIKCAND
jgi:hypothetical protein